MLLKKFIVKFLTNNPYQIQRFEKIYDEPVGNPIEKIESLTAILKKEAGEILIYSSSPISYNESVNHRYVNEDLRFAAHGIFKAPERTVYSVSNGCIIGQLGLIYDIKTRSFIDESAKDWSQNLKRSAFANAFKLPERTNLDGITISFLSNGAEGGFYHFLFESLVKLEMYEGVIGRANQILFNGPPTEWKHKWLLKAGIEVSKIVWVENTLHYKCDQLIFTNRLVGDQQINHWCIAALKKLFKINPVIKPDLKSSRVIWISRKGLGNREILWEREIATRFPDIEMIDLTTLSVDQTIAIMQSATHVLGSHGAGFSNIYLCAPNTKILEVYPIGSYFQPCYQRLAEICNLKYELAYINFTNHDDQQTGLSTLFSAIKKQLC
ncbi:MAG: glycosyltransferase family 61 protein [Pedobacter sp.]|nr:MAG: glycosyltransferase family 61 protein [Pedobacter sp.]